MTKHAFSNLSNAKTFANERRAAGRTCRIFKTQQTLVGTGRNPWVNVITTFMVEVA
tara:strand:+ start:125 stop:292 length:168 start_codon:yes stop_codon:yes gene_type:complete